MGDGERHILRLFTAVLVAILIASLPNALNGKTVETMALTVSVLAGFSFTALFSSHSHSVSDLPEGQSESDRHDIRILLGLIDNFGERSRYFLTISVIALIALFLLSVPVSVEEVLSIFSELSHFNNVMNITTVVWAVGSWTIRVLCLIMFFEILYTFYRIAETTFAILNVRRDYLNADR